MPIVYFATDIHGSDICWKKFLAAAAYYKADVLMLGGDMSGKAIIPLVRDGSIWRSVLLGSTYELESTAALQDFEKRVRSRGYYPVRMDRAERDNYMQQPEVLHQRFNQAVRETLETWLAMADERLAADVVCLVCPGNDDTPELDAILAGSRIIENSEGRCIDIGGFWLASTGWTNRTPWQTYREESEEALGRRIAGMLSDRIDFSRAIFNFHCPPHASGLDEAPELSADLSVRNAGQATVPVGSSAVRTAITRHQPLLSLHGHIHEAKGVTRIGRTLAVNPGSLYEQGVLQGVLLDLDARKGIRNYVLTTG
jgi:hypothetical protein